MSGSLSPHPLLRHRQIHNRKRLIMACNLYLIQCPASCAFDLKVVNPTHSGKESITFSATNVSKHLQSLKFSARLRPARASSEGHGWLAGTVCDLASPLGVTAPSGVALSFLAAQMPPELVGAFSFLWAQKNRLVGRFLNSLSWAKLIVDRSGHQSHGTTKRLQPLPRFS